MLVAAGCLLSICLFRILCLDQASEPDRNKHKEFSTTAAARRLWISTPLEPTPWLDYKSASRRIGSQTGTEKFRSTRRNNHRADKHKPCAFIEVLSRCLWIPKRF